MRFNTPAINWNMLSKAVKKQQQQPEEIDASSDDNSDDSFTEDTGKATTTKDQQSPQSPLSAVHGTRQESTQQIPEKPADLQQAKDDPKSLFWDPYAVIDALGYKDRPSPMTYATATALTWKMPILQAIIKTRVDQMKLFSEPAINKYQTGYRVALRDPKQKATPASSARAQQLEQFVLATGVTTHAENRDDFETFLAKVTRDSMMFDQMTFEVVPSMSGVPAEFYAVDASTIRIADTTKLFISPEDEEAVRFVQVYDNLVINEYSSGQLCFGVRNPSSNIRLQGYGQSEIEMLVTTITALLWSWDYNQKFFSQGASAKGILNFTGVVPENRLKSFRRHWYSMVAGVENAFKTPIMNADGAQWIDMQKSNRDMEFNAWMDFLIKVTSAIFAIDPMEINFKYGDTGGGKAMFESANQSKLTASKDKGLKPLVRFLQRKIDSHIIRKIDPDFKFEFVGLESDSPSEQADLNTKLVKTTRTIDELRALEDLEPLPNGMGDLILDPTFLQHMQQAAQQQMGTGAFAQPQQPDDNGDGNDDTATDSDNSDGNDSDNNDDANEFDSWGSDTGDNEEDDGTEKSLRKSKVKKPAKKKFVLSFTV